MGIWEFVVAYLVIFVLLQFAVYRYLQQDDDGAAATLGSLPNAESGPFPERSVDHDRVPRQAGDRDEDQRGAGDRDADPGRQDALDADSGVDVDESATRQCPHCGVANAADGTFTFCRNCASPLRR